MLLPILPIAILASLTSVTGVSLQMNAGCGFRLTVEGGFNGSVGQLANGQARAGGDLAPSLFTWFGDAFADQEGRGCWWTPPTSVLQCDWNQRPDHGFGIGCYGGVSYRAQSTFYECQTGNEGEVNIYLQSNGSNCSMITLHADSCRPLCAGESPGSSSPSAGQTPAPFQLSTSATARDSSQVATTTSPSPAPTEISPSTPGQCDVVVAKNPDEIVLIDKGNPDTIYGPNPNMIVQLSPNASAIFVFRLTFADAGKQCALVFDLPPATQQQSPKYSLTGSGLVSFALLNGAPTDPANTTYGNAPSVVAPLEAVTLRPGMSVEPLSFACPNAEVEIAVQMRDEPGSTTCLEYQQDGMDVLIGLYLVKC